MGRVHELERSQGRNLWRNGALIVELCLLFNLLIFFLSIVLIIIIRSSSSDSCSNIYISFTLSIYIYKYHISQSIG